MATSTFGGGGGTKVFCSQALNNMAKADMINAIREAVAALCKREDFIPLPQLHLSKKKTLIEVPFVSEKNARFEEAFCRALIPIIRLRWNRKPKMMRPTQVVLPTSRGF
jgi:hypothetical protein